MPYPEAADSWQEYQIVSCFKNTLRGLRRRHPCVIEKSTALELGRRNWNPTDHGAWSSHLTPQCFRFPIK